MHHAPGEDGLREPIGCLCNRRCLRFHRIDKFAEAFGKEKAAVLLKVLQAVKDVKPTLDTDGKKATFKLKEKVEGAPRDTITFVQVDKFWYILN